MFLLVLKCVFRNLSIGCYICHLRDAISNHILQMSPFLDGRFAWPEKFFKVFFFDYYYRVISIRKTTEEIKKKMVKLYSQLVALMPKANSNTVTTGNPSSSSATSHSLSSNLRFLSFFLFFVLVWWTQVYLKLHCTPSTSTSTSRCRELCLSAWAIIVVKTSFR